MKVEYWPHRGSFEESKKNKKVFNSLYKAIKFIVSSASVLNGVPAFNINDIYIKHYGYDSRLENECFMVCISKHTNNDYIRKYGCPQCIGFLYFDKFTAAQPSYNKISALGLKTFLVEDCDIPYENIETWKEYCHFINSHTYKEQQT